MAKFKFSRAAHEVRENTGTVKRRIIIAIAFLLLLVGVVGTLIPLFPGRVLALPSLILFSIYSPTVYALVKRKSDGHPKVESIFDRTRNWVIRKLH